MISPLPSAIYPDLALYRNPPRSGWWDRFINRRADRDLRALMARAPVPAGADADIWVQDALYWAYKYIRYEDRHDNDAFDVTTARTLETMSAWCSGYAILLCSMGKSALHPSDWPRLRYVQNDRHAWAVWTTRGGIHIALDAVRSPHPLTGDEKQDYNEEVSCDA
jgi:hypothetical protein